MDKDTKSRIQWLLEQANEIDKDVASFTTLDDLLRGILRTNIAIVELLINTQMRAETEKLDVNGAPLKSQFNCKLYNVQHEAHKWSNTTIWCNGQASYAANGVDGMGNPVCGASIDIIDQRGKRLGCRCVSEAHGDEWPHKVELPATI